MYLHSDAITNALPSSGVITADTQSKSYLTRLKTGGFKHMLDTVKQHHLSFLTC